MDQITESSGKQKKGRFVGILVDVVLILAIILALVCTYAAYVSKSGSGVPKILGFEVFSIQSDSMSPTFDQGDLIIDKEVKDTSELKVGDIISFWTIIDGYKVVNTHRIVEIETGESFTFFYTKGDNNSRMGALTVHENDVIGIHKSTISGLGKVLDFLQTSKGFFITIVLPVFAFFLYYLVSFFRTLFEYKKVKNRLEFEQEQKARSETNASDVELSDEVISAAIELLKKQQAEEAIAAEKTEETVEKVSEAALEAVEVKASEEPSEAAEEPKEEEKITLTKEQLLKLLKQAGIDGEDLNK